MLNEEQKKSLIGCMVEVGNGNLAVIKNIKNGQMFADMNSKVGEAKTVQSYQLEVELPSGETILSNPLIIKDFTKHRVCPFCEEYVQFGDDGKAWCSECKTNIYETKVEFA